MKSSITLSTAAAIAGLLAFGGPLAAAKFSPELQALIKKANAEGKLHVSWSSNSLGGASGARLIQKRMNKMFGTNIKISFSPGRSMPGMSAKISAEAAAGRDASSDLYLGAAWTTLPLIKRKNVVIFPWTKLLPGRITAFEVEGDGASVRIAVGLPGVTYNTKLMPVKKRPTVLTDFLDPAWKGKLASTPYAAGFDTISAHGAWGPKKTIAFVREFSKQVRGLIRCGEGERIATGEYFALVMDCTGQDALLWQAKGAPVANFIPLDAAQKRYYYLTVPKNSANKNAAALYAVFIMTKEGQKTAWDTWRVDLDSFPGSHLRKRVQEVEAKGGKFISATIDFIIKHPEVDETKKVLVKILKSTRKKKK
jgi:iron(III) transport system substrate-binding protein